MGRLHDSLAEYSPRAESLLTRCVKLVPGSPEGWTALAHCFFKKRDSASAKSCLEESIKRRPTAAAWRLLSQLLRQMKAETDGPLAGVQASIDAATSAITLDVADARSWAILANAYLGLFFGSASNDLTVLAKAHKAYSQAARAERERAKTLALAPADADVTTPALSAVGAGAPVGLAVPLPAAAGDADGPEAAHCRALVAGLRLDGRDPDLHFNWAQVLSFQEDYEAALAHFQEAAEIDPSLGVSVSLLELRQPLFPAFAAYDTRTAHAFAERLQEEIEAIRRHVDRASDLCARHAGLKGKRLQGTVAACVLPAYSNTAAGRAVLGARTLATVAELEPGGNPGKYVLLKPVLALPKRGKPPRCDTALPHALPHPSSGPAAAPADAAAWSCWVPTARPWPCLRTTSRRAWWPG